MRKWRMQGACGTRVPGLARESWKGRLAEERGADSLLGLTFLQV